MWIGMQDRGVCEYIVNKKTFWIPPPLQNWKSGQVNCLMKIENNLWIGTDNNGILDYEINGELPVKHYTSGDNLQLSKINDLLEDNEHNAWVANNNEFV